MSFKSLIAGRGFFVGVAVSAFAALPLLLDAHPGRATDRFPFDQELLLDAAPMRPAKRMPILTVAPDGNATIDLWCRTVPARVQLSDSAIRVEPGPLPEGLPQYMSEGQCTEQRLRADEDMIAALAQMTEWRRQGGGVVLNGPRTLRFRISSH